MKIYYILPLILTTGCASIIHGTNDQVTANSLERNTIIYIDGAPRGKDTAQAELKRGKVHTIRAEKDGCQPVSMETSKKFDPTSLLGIFIDFGIITIPLDFAMGGAQEIDPKSYTVTPICAK